MPTNPIFLMTTLKNYWTKIQIWAAQYLVQPLLVYLPNNLLNLLAKASWSLSKEATAFKP